jgi:hypothetical protein
MKFPKNLLANKLREGKLNERNKFQENSRVLIDSPGRVDFFKSMVHDS